MVSFTSRHTLNSVVCICLSFYGMYGYGCYINTQGIPLTLTDVSCLMALLLHPSIYHQTIGVLLAMLPTSS